MTTEARTEPPNPHKEPHHAARFRFTLGGNISIGTFSEISGLTVEMEVETYAEGGVNDYVHKFPGRLKYQNVVLKRGLTDTDALLDWFMSASEHKFKGINEAHIAMLDSMGNTVRGWAFFDVFPVKWSGPQLSAASTDIAVEELEFSHSGFLKA